MGSYSAAAADTDTVTALSPFSKPNVAVAYQSHHPIAPLEAKNENREPCDKEMLMYLH